jgi:hypothetical protein
MIEDAAARFGSDGLNALLIDNFLNRKTSNYKPPRGKMAYFSVRERPIPIGPFSLLRVWAFGRRRPRHIWAAPRLLCSKRTPITPPD